MARIAGPQMFCDAAGIGISGGQFIAAQGDVHVYQNSAKKSALSRPPEAFNEVLSDTDLYCEQLWPKRRGFPLYVPMPQRNLPPEYLIEGVSIGDVGMVTPEGFWDFFFNVFRPADHPINVGRVPEGFTPLHPYGELDLHNLEFEPGTSACSSSVQSRNDDFDDFPGSDFVFRCGPPKGAVLCLPFGSRLQKLARYQDHIRDYAAQNAKSWYQYINGRLGRGMPNGGLYIITGHEKAVAGGIATFQNVAEDTDFNVIFRSFPHAGAPGEQRYRFNRGTPAETRVFPPLSSPAETNNTLFLQGYRVSLGLGVWNALFGGAVGVQAIEDAPAPGKKGNRAVPFGSSRFAVANLFNTIVGGGGGGGKNALSEGVVVSELVGQSKVVHPSRILHNHIHERVSDANVIITHDDDWQELLGSPECQTPHAVNLDEQADIEVEGGVAYLVHRRGASAVDPQPSEWEFDQATPLLSEDGSSAEDNSDPESESDDASEPCPVPDASPRRAALISRIFGKKPVPLDPDELKRPFVYQRRPHSDKGVFVRRKYTIPYHVSASTPVLVGYGRASDGGSEMGDEDVDSDSDGGGVFAFSAPLVA
ncbi:Pleiotropic drug resistance ABC transporter protein [Mycena kentingensis (nom. inval.)]|nr:Pleiotropic drug resistance ABC transporter protein [Mycena kentingensis (nom. inval.)]